MHNQVQKAYHCLHVVLSFLRVYLESQTETDLCAALYTDNAFQRT